MSESSIGRIAGALVSPAKTFESIAKRPTWAVALVVLVAVSVLVAWLMAGRMDFGEIVRESIEERGQQVSEEQLANAIETQERIGPVLTVAGAGVFAPLFYLAAALVFWLLFKFGGGEFSYKSSLAATVHGFLPMGVAGLLHLPVILGRDSIGYADVRGGSNLLASNLGFFAPEDAGPVLSGLLSSVDVFSIWVIVLLGYGFAAVAGVSRKAAWTTVAVLWLVAIGCKLGWLALTT